MELEVEKMNYCVKMAQSEYRPIKRFFFFSMNLTELELFYKEDEWQFVTVRFLGKVFWLLIKKFFYISWLNALICVGRSHKIYSNTLNLVVLMLQNVKTKAKKVLGYEYYSMTLISVQGRTGLERQMLVFCVFFMWPQHHPSDLT